MQQVLKLLGAAQEGRPRSRSSSASSSSSSASGKASRSRSRAANERAPKKTIEKVATKYIAKLSKMHQQQEAPTDAAETAAGGT